MIIKLRISCVLHGKMLLVIIMLPGSDIILSNTRNNPGTTYVYKC